MKKIIGILFVFIIPIAMVIPANAQFATGCLLSTFTPWCYEGSAAKTSPSITQILAPDGTAAAPGISFGSDPDTGFYNSSAGSIVATLDGSVSFRMSTSGIFLHSVFPFGWTAGTALNTLDVILARDAPGTLALRNAANAQEFRVYKTTDSGFLNYSRVVQGFINTPDVYEFTSETLGTGTVNEFAFTGGQVKFSDQIFVKNKLARTAPSTDKWIIFGDSVSDSLTADYPVEVIANLGLTGTENHAVGGNRMIEQLAALDALLLADSTALNGFNILSLLVGINDFVGNSVIGSRTDTAASATFAGYMMDFIETALTANPNLVIHLMTPMEANGSGALYQATNTAGWTVRDLSILISQIASDYGVKVIDLYSLSQFNLQTFSTYTSDSLHPNAVGRAVIGKIISEAFSSPISAGNTGDMFGTLSRHGTASGITASTTQTQGNGALTLTVNEISVVAILNDTVTLPTAAIGAEVNIINNGVNTLQIFPASGDNLGAGLNIATTLAAGSNIRFIAYDVTNWEIL